MCSHTHTQIYLHFNEQHRMQDLEEGKWNVVEWARPRKTDSIQMIPKQIGWNANESDILLCVQLAGKCGLRCLSWNESQV